MFPNIGKAIKKFAKILKEDEDCREVFPEECFRVSYKREHKNLKEIVAPSRFAFASHGEIVKCGFLRKLPLLCHANAVDEN